MAAMVLSMLDAGPTVPSEVHREDRQAEHHPAEDAAYPVGIGQMRVGCLRIDQGTNADTDGGRSGREHGPGKNPAPASMQGAALTTEHGDPERNEAQAAKEDVQHYEGMKQGYDGFGHLCDAADLAR